jgi:ABC-type spermidine/putrescine transport system permease subunit I
MLAGLALPFVFIVSQSLGDHSNFAVYAQLLDSRLFRRITLTTFEISLAATLLSCVIAYPIALHLARQSSRRRRLLIVLVLLPFWTSILVKSYSYIVILGDQGFINWGLAAVGIGRIELIFNRIGVLIGMANYLTPFVVFPLLSNLLHQDANVVKAAELMGASATRIFLTITFPLSIPGLSAGAIMCFVLSLGFFITPTLLGGRKDMMIANLIDFYLRQALDWPTASAIAVILLATTGLLLSLLGRSTSNQGMI